MDFLKRDIDRFFSKLKPDGDCILFQQNSKCQYGLFNYQCPYTGRRVRIGAHRFSYMLNFGHIPDGMFVMHQCDTPRCCHPSHLYLGTPQDNTNDMMAKGRHPTMISKMVRKSKSRAKINAMFLRWKQKRNPQ